MAALLTACRSCGREYQIERSDTIRGYRHWSLCPDCRPECSAESEAELETPIPEGLGTDLATIRRLCSNEVEVLDLIGQAVKNPVGGDKRSDAFRTTVDNVHSDTERPTGNSPEAALRRLRKDRPDIHGRVIAGELSPHADPEGGSR